MSTVFKLKAALLMACAFVVVSVSTAWGQTGSGNITPSVPDGSTITEGQSSFVTRSTTVNLTPAGKNTGMDDKNDWDDTYQYSWWTGDGLSLEVTGGKPSLMGGHVIEFLNGVNLNCGEAKLPGVF